MITYGLASVTRRSLSEVEKVFCFRCRSKFVEKNGHLTCIAGDMPLSTSMEEALLSRFPNPANSEVDADLDTLRWYCPGCGGLLKDFSCEGCDVSLWDLRFQLVEYHPHKDSLGNYF